MHLITPKEAKEACPILSTDGIIGGMWAEREGYVDTTGTVYAYAKAAKKRGAKVIEHNRVLGLRQTRDGWEVITEKGTIKTEHMVNAGGLWAKQVGRMAGIELPLSPLNHHYLITETILEVAALDKEMPMVVDLEGVTYMRQDQKGLLLGIYEINREHGMMDGAPWDYGMQLHPLRRAARRRCLRAAGAPFEGRRGQGTSQARPPHGRDHGGDRRERPEPDGQPVPCPDRGHVGSRRQHLSRPGQGPGRRDHPSEDHRPRPASAHPLDPRGAQAGGDHRA